MVTGPEPDSGPAARVAILDATLALLAEAGSAGVPLTAVAERAGFSRQAIYRHFGSRAGLIAAALSEIDRRGRAEEAVRELLATGDGLAALTALIDWWSEYVESFVGVARNVLAGRAGDPALAAAWEQRMQALLTVCGMVVDRCDADGVLRADLDREAATEMLWALLSVPLWDQLISDRGWSKADYRKRIGMLARSGLTTAARPV